MKRVQVQFTQEQLDGLRAQAVSSDRSVAAIVRDAVDAWITDNERGRLVDGAILAIGGFHSGLGDLAENHDRYLDEALEP